MRHFRAKNTDFIYPVIPAYHVFCALGHNATSVEAPTADELPEWVRLSWEAGEISEPDTMITACLVIQPTGNQVVADWYHPIICLPDGRIGTMDMQLLLGLFEEIKPDWPS